MSKVHATTHNNYPLCNTNYTRIVKTVKQTNLVTCKKCIEIIKKKHLK